MLNLLWVGMSGIKRRKWELVEGIGVKYGCLLNIFFQLLFLDKNAAFLSDFSPNDTSELDFG